MDPKDFITSQCWDILPKVLVVHHFSHKLRRETHWEHDYFTKQWWWYLHPLYNCCKCEGRLCTKTSSCRRIYAEGKAWHLRSHVILSRIFGSYAPPNFEALAIFFTHITRFRRNFEIPRKKRPTPHIRPNLNLLLDTTELIAETRLVSLTAIMGGVSVRDVDVSSPKPSRKHTDLGPGRDGT